MPLLPLSTTVSLAGSAGLRNCVAGTQGGALHVAFAPLALSMSGTSTIARSAAGTGPGGALSVLSATSAVLQMVGNASVAGCQGGDRWGW